MNSNLIDFINYDEPDRNDFYPKLEIEFENPRASDRFEGSFFEDPFQQNLNPPALDRLDSNIFNSIFNSESQQTSVVYQTSESDYQPHHNYQSSHYFREKKEEMSTTSDDNSTVHVLPEPISTKSKRILKREQAKERSQRKHQQKYMQEVEKQQKQSKQEKAAKAEKEDKSENYVSKLTEEAILSGEIPAKFIPEGFSASLDPKTKKKMIQMIRNRISAQNSRDRKKNLIDGLESQQKELADENLRLKLRVKQLEAENGLLKRENQQFKKAFDKAANAFGQAQSDIFAFDIEESPFEGQSSNYSTGSADISGSGNSSPIYRAPSMRSGGFMKYSLALATIFAVLMFNGLNAPMSSQMAPIDVKTNAPMQTETFQVPASKAKFARAERLLEEEVIPKLNIVPDFSVKVEDKMIGEYPLTLPTVNSNIQMSASSNIHWASTELINYPFVSQMSNLQQNFNEKYMSTFFNQLKIVDPAVLKNFQESLKLNIVPTAKEMNFPSYLRASRRTLPDFSNSTVTNQTQIVPFVGSDNQKLPIINGENFASIFFPAGFEFQGQEDSSFVKVEEGAIPSSPQKKLKIVDSEWLQLFVPKNNISIAKLSGQDGLYITPTENDAGDDNTILEVWCKVFYVRELPSAF